jgi:predicted RNase H-like HicB family nuclease
MKDLEEQRVRVKFCFKLGKTFTETFQMLQQAYGEECLSRTQCYECYQSFKSGRTSIEDEMKENSLQDLRAIPQNTFKDAFQNWKKRWERCINSRGEYSEGDKSD